MNKAEIVQCIANIHNRLAQIMVSGDNAIMMGEALKELRALVRILQKDMEDEQAESDRKLSKDEKPA